MQDLPITTATQPVIPAQMPNPADNASAQAAEPFGDVLARQRANSGAPNTRTRDKNQTSSSSAPSSSTDRIPADTGNERETPIRDAISILPGDMLAALLPVSASMNSVATNEKPVSQASAPDGASILPGDMLTALLPMPTMVRQDTSAVTRQQPAVDVRGGTRQQPAATNVRGGVQQFTNTGQPAGEQTAISLFRAQGNTMPTVATTDTIQGKTFSSALETLGKNTINTALPTGATQTSAQTALPDANILISLTQSTTSPVAASQNYPVQSVVNTPVTHDVWGDEFNQKITWLATQHEQTAELHLNPPHLGPLDVVLSISGDQATALFTSPHVAVREAVEQALPRLREMMADNGIMLGNATVNDQSTREHQAGQADKQRGGSLPGKISDAVPAIGTVLPARRHQGMVDTFV